MTYHKKALTTLFVFIALLWTSVFIVAADNGGRDVSGGFQLQGIVCDQGIGFCGVGTSTGDIPGDVFVVLTTLSIDPNTGSQSYTGTFEITSPRGDFSGTIAATISFNGSTTSLDNVGTIHLTQGTRAYSQMEATLSLVGTIAVPSQFETDTYSGVLSNVNGN